MRIHILIIAMISLELSCKTAEQNSSSIFEYINQDLKLQDIPSGLTFIDQIYVINLDIRYERWLNVKKQLDSFALSPQRVRAINGWSMERQELKTLYKTCIEKSYHRYFTQGQIGCFLSHLSILQHAFNKKYRCIWILEDDILVLEDIKELSALVEMLQTFDPDWDVLFTDCNSRGETENNIWTLERFVGEKFDYSVFEDPTFIPQENHRFKRIQYRIGTHSMIISSRGIKKLLEYFKEHKIFYPIDVQMHCYRDRHIYVSKKEYVTNDKRQISDTLIKPVFEK
jgi:GR25 family glycosyltransferase involved in LPS biosynthesis